MSEFIARTLLAERLNLVLVGSFAVLALLLASIGLHGRLAPTVSRSREFASGWRWRYSGEPSRDGVPRESRPRFGRPRRWPAAFGGADAPALHDDYGVAALDLLTYAGSMLRSSVVRAISRPEGLARPLVLRDSEARTRKNLAKAQAAKKAIFWCFTLVHFGASRGNREARGAGEEVSKQSASTQRKPFSWCFTSGHFGTSLGTRVIVRRARFGGKKFRAKTQSRKEK